MNGPPVLITFEPRDNPCVGVSEMPLTICALSWAITSIWIRPFSPVRRTLRLSGSLLSKRTSTTLPLTATTVPSVNCSSTFLPPMHRPDQAVFFSPPRVRHPLPFCSSSQRFIKTPLFALFLCFHPLVHLAFHQLLVALRKDVGGVIEHENGPGQALDGLVLLHRRDEDRLELGIEPDVSSHQDEGI